jgi:hypothetical protein
MAQLLGMKWKRGGEWYPLKSDGSGPSYSRVNRLGRVASAYASLLGRAQEMFAQMNMDIPSQMVPVLGWGTLYNAAYPAKWDFISPPGTAASQEMIQNLEQRYQDLLRAREQAGTSEEKAELEAQIKALREEIQRMSQQRPNGKGIDTTTMLLIGGGILAAVFVLPKLLGGRGRV